VRPWFSFHISYLPRFHHFLIFDCPHHLSTVTLLEYGKSGYFSRISWRLWWYCEQFMATNQFLSVMFCTCKPYLFSCNPFVKGVVMWPEHV
jgi:hypothetical protein